MTAFPGFLRNRALVSVCQVVVGFVFLFAALAKIGDAGGFAVQIHHYRLVPGGFENLVAITLPWIELVAALTILLRFNPRAGAVVSAGCMALFVVVVAAAVARHLDIECGCFGTADAAKVGTAKLAENVGLFLMAVVASLTVPEPSRP